MAYVRVRDKDTGHEFDALEDDWRIDAGHFVPIKSDRYPVADIVRPPKHNVGPRATLNKKEAADNG
jgi:hypothetical protein